MINIEQSPGIFEYMFKMFSQDQKVEVNRIQHIPILLLHRKFEIPVTHATPKRLKDI